MTIYNRVSRRRFLQTTAATAAASALAKPLCADEPMPRGQAQHCIFLWMGGGMAHIDTFDPKRKGNPSANRPGCYYDSIPTAVPGVRVVEHLRRTAAVMDRITLIRTLHHDLPDEHATATHFVHTGRRVSDTISYPSLGSLVASQLPAQNGMPPYVVIGYPNASRDPGFLGPRCGYLHVADLEGGLAGFVRPHDVDVARQDRRRRLLAQLRTQATRDATIAPQNDAIDQFQRLAGPEFRRIFQLDREPNTLRESYGGEFGQRCLLARRLVESGVRFVEVSFNLNFINGTGWDTHNEGQLRQHLLIQDLDAALSTLITDLEQRRLLDRVVIAIGTEFGRPPQFDAGGGRGHQSRCFSGFLAGGGLRHGRAIGESDELAQRIASRPVSIPDYHATICCALGIDPSRELYDGSRPVPITDGGRAVGELFG